MAILASAALWSADNLDETQAMLEGLAVATASQHWLELLLDAPVEAPTIRFLKSGPTGVEGLGRDLDFGGDGPDDGDIPHIKMPSKGGIPGLTGPPSLDDLFHTKPKIVFDPLAPGGLSFGIPIHQVTCIELAKIMDDVAVDDSHVRALKRGITRGPHPSIAATSAASIM